MHTKKTIFSVLILWHLFTLLVDGMPSSTLLQDNLEYHLSRYMNTVAQWQGSLAFFAPSPDSLNLHLEADLEYTDGTKAHWRSPDWKKLSVREKFVNGRMVKFIDNLRRDDNKATWDGFANYLVRQYERDGKHVRHIDVSRHWVDIPAPPDKVYNKLEDLPHKERYTFFRKDYPV